MKLTRRMLNGKIHRATVTEANLDYEGSLTIDRDLMDAADILENEEIHVWNVTRGTRLSTYAIEGQAGSGVICANGAAAHHIGPGDLVIISSFVELPDSDARSHRPKVVLVDADNRIMLTAATEVAGPARRAAEGG